VRSVWATVDRAIWLIESEFLMPYGHLTERDSAVGYIADGGVQRIDSNT
jgi:hypothetical protein